MKRAVFVTGATGLVGGALVPRLLASGARVHALARSSAVREPAGVRWHTGDLADVGSLGAALRAARSECGDAELDVVHAGALISYRRADATAAAAVNVDATRALLAAARAADVRCFLYVSSVVTVGVASSADAELDEDAVFNGDERSHYVATKRAAEQLVLAERELDVRVVNPGVIHGVGSRPSNSNRFLQRIARGQLPPLVPPGSLSVVAVEDVAEGILRAFERGRRGRRYLLTESNLRLSELYRRAGDELGVRIPRLRAGPRTWSAVCAAAALLDRVRPLELATPQALRLLGRHLCFSSRRARNELGWAPEPFERVLPRVLASLSERGWL